MEKGFYHNGDNEVVFCGNRKPVDPAGLTWVQGHQNEWSEPLTDLGLSTHIWDGTSIVENPDYIAAKTDYDSRVTEIQNEQATGGLKDITVQQAKDVITGRYDTVRALPVTGANNAETIANIEAKIDALINACQWVDVIEAVYLLR